MSAQKGLRVPLPPLQLQADTGWGVSTAARQSRGAAQAVARTDGKRHPCKTNHPSTSSREAALPRPGGHLPLWLRPVHQGVRPTPLRAEDFEDRRLRATRPGLGWAAA